MYEKFFHPLDLPQNFNYTAKNSKKELKIYSAQKVGGFDWFLFSKDMCL